MSISEVIWSEGVGLLEYAYFNGRYWVILYIKKLFIIGDIGANDLIIW